LTLELLIVAAARILGSLPVLRWAFAGALIAIAVDFSDLFMISLIHLGGVDDYQSADKWLDLVYMVTFLAVALRWAGTVRNVAVGLFAFRMIGVASFEITHARAVLLAFPNVFEFWFVGVSWFRHWKPRYEFTARRVVIWLLVALALKMVQEWVLHGGRYLDKYEAVQVVTDWWDRIAGLF
jgi:hypothetical protein